MNQNSRKFQSQNITNLALFQCQISPRKYTPISPIFQIIYVLEHIGIAPRIGMEHWLSEPERHPGCWCSAPIPGTES